MTIQSFIVLLDLKFQITLNCNNNNLSSTYQLIDVAETTFFMSRLNFMKQNYERISKKPNF